MVGKTSSNFLSKWTSSTIFIHVWCQFLDCVIQSCLNFENLKCQMCKVNSVQEACAKCFAAHMLKFEIMQITWKKEHQTLIFQFFVNKSSILMRFVLFFHVVFRISNFNVWTARHLCKLLVLSWLYYWHTQKFSPLIITDCKSKFHWKK